MSFENVYTDIQPKVINTAMLEEVIDSQRPKGEAGRLVREEGIAMSEVEVLRLEYKSILLQIITLDYSNETFLSDILRIDHLWMLTGLTKLSLNNNLIEKIENLSELVNLKELDLSFNYIEKIENINGLVNLEILTFYSNLIKKIENIEDLRQLHIFSIGKNLIEDRENVCLIFTLFFNLRLRNLIT